MKLSIALASAAVLGSASARVLHAADADDISRISDAQALPPMTINSCGKDSDSAVVESVELSPNPPQLSKPLEVKVKGTLKKDITKGATVDLNIAAGFFNTNKSFDICDFLKENEDKFSGDEKLLCPIEAAEGKTWDQTINLPNLNLPSFIKNVKVKAVVKNKDGSQISCQNINWQLH